MTLKKDEIQEAVKDPDWQKYRQSLKGKSTEQKEAALEQWRVKKGFSKEANTQTENYRNALKRAGQLGKK